jgi:hypothetical protein
MVTTTAWTPTLPVTKTVLRDERKQFGLSNLLAKKWKHNGATISKQNLFYAGTEAQSIGAGTLVEFNSGK